MNEPENTENSHVQPLGLYRVAGGAGGGWDRFNPLASRTFLQASLVMSMFGLLCGISWYLFNNDIVGMRMRSVINHVASHMLFISGLGICGHLAARRWPLLLAFLATSALWQYQYCEDHRMKTLGVFVASWLIIWWVITEPEIMEWYGLRKKAIARDAAWGIISAALVFAYFTGLLAAFGYGFHYSLWETAATTTGHLTFQLLIFMFFFMVLRKLSFSGMNNWSSVAVVALLAFMYQAPTFASFFIAGKIDLTMMAVGLIANTLILVIIMSVLFNMHKNVISAVCVETIVMVMLNAAGLI